MKDLLVIRVLCEKWQLHYLQDIMVLGNIGQEEMSDIIIKQAMLRYILHVHVFNYLALCCCM